MKFSRFNIVSYDENSLTNRQVFQMVAESMPVFKKFVKTYKTELVHITHIHQLEELLAAFEPEIHKSSKSQHAKDLKAADKNRDNLLDIFLSFLDVYAKFEDPTIHAAYEKLRTLLKQYKGIKKESYQMESESLNHLLKNLAKPDYQAALQTLSLTQHVTNLRTAEENFERIFQNRLDEKAHKTIGRAKELREQVLDAFDLLVYYTAFTAKADANKAHYIPLRDQLNAIITGYKKSKRKAKEATEEANPETTDDLVE